MSELILSREGRPAIIEHQGARIFVSVRDQYHIRERKAWKERLFWAHPDRVQTGTSPGRKVYHGSNKKQAGQGFIRLYQRYQRWLEEEREYYRSLNLEPPRWGD